MHNGCGPSSESGNSSNKVLDGYFKNVDATRGADEVGHHIPQNAYTEMLQNFKNKWKGINKMTYDEDILGKCAIIDWEQYKKININSFVLDEETQVEQLEEVLLEIKKLDNSIKIFVSTYPIEKNENGIRMYSDMLWIKTKLECIQLESLFAKYRQSEPSSIFDLTEDEKGYVDIYIDTEFQHREFAGVSNLFKIDEIKILYWD